MNPASAGGGGELPSILNLSHLFPKNATGAADAEDDFPSTLMAPSSLRPFSFTGSSSSAAAAAGGAAALPHNPLEGLVGVNLQQWMEEEEEEGGEDAEGGSDVEEDAEEGKDEDTEMVDIASSTAAASSSQHHLAAAASSALAAPSNSIAAPSAAAASAAAASSPPAKPKKPRKKRPAPEDSHAVADDSVELNEILGTGFGGATSKGRGSRGKMILLRKGRRAGKLSKLTPELEKRMGEANSAYINQEFARAVDILLHIIQSAPHAEGPYHTLGLIYEERGDLGKAVEAYLLAAHMSKRDWGLWKRVAKMAVECGQYQHAIYCWTKVLGSETENDEIRWERAVRRE
jgi:hypothetical protein